MPRQTSSLQSLTRNIRAPARHYPSGNFSPISFTVTLGRKGSHDQKTSSQYFKSRGAQGIHHQTKCGMQFQDIEPIKAAFLWRESKEDLAVGETARGARHYVEDTPSIQGPDSN